MSPIYFAEISPVYGWLLLFVLLAACSVIFIVIPGIKRGREKSGGRLLAQVRVVAFFGKGGMHFGGGFYRFSAYENCLVVCLFCAILYKYREIRLRFPYEAGSNRLNLVLRGIPVTLYGNSRDLGILVEKIRGRESVAPALKK